MGKFVELLLSAASFARRLILLGSRRDTVSSNSPSPLPCESSSSSWIEARAFGVAFTRVRLGPAIEDVFLASWSVDARRACEGLPPFILLCLRLVVILECWWSSVRRVVARK